MAKKVILLMGAFWMMFWVSLLLPATGDNQAAGAPPAQPSPRPTLNRPTFPPPSASGGQSDDGDDDGPRDSCGPYGAIYGTVTDLTAYKPGAGLEVSVNGSIVRTDVDGSYSITGLDPGLYTVMIHQLPEDWIPDPDQVIVNLPCSVEKTIANLNYYTIPPTPAPQVVLPAIISAAVPISETPAVAPPTTIPQAGAPARGPLYLMAGLLLAVLGGGLLGWSRKYERHSAPPPPPEEAA